MDECERRRDLFRSSQAEVLETGFSKEQNRKVKPEELEGIKAIRFECEYREFRPALGSSA